MPTLAIRLVCLVPLLAGGAGAALGSGLLDGPGAASHLRYLSGLLFGIGVVAWWCAGDLRRRRGILGGLCAVVVTGGVARLAGLMIDGVPPWPHVVALGIELAVVPGLWAATFQDAAGRRGGAAPDQSSA